MVRGFKPTAGEKGLTVIELLATLAIAGFVIAAIYSFHLTGIKGWQRAVSKIDDNQSARIAMDKIIRELRYANSISLHEQGREIRFTAPHDRYRTLRFRLAGGEVVYDSFPTGSSLYFNTKVAQNIKSINFSLKENQLIEIVIETGETGGGALLKGSVYPRNLPHSGDFTDEHD
jgi:prepilin-type N-terminal cleavage/methylation domain-containing protein